MPSRRRKTAITGALLLLLITGCAGGSGDDLACAESLLDAYADASSEAAESVRDAAQRLPGTERVQREVIEDLEEAANVLDVPAGQACA